jgi:hypothetical protein
MTAPSPPVLLAASYAEARAAFLRACADAGAELSSQRHPLPGPDGAPLFLDAARFGAPDARRVLLLASGTHGVEGFCGSGIQTWLLRGGLASRLPDGVALVLVHAVNPWGFAWLRRVNRTASASTGLPRHRAPHPEPVRQPLQRAQPEPRPRRSRAASATPFERARLGRLYRPLGGQYRHPRGVSTAGGPVWSNRGHALWVRHAADASSRSS